MALVVNLLPYFREIQEQDLKLLNEFFEDLAKFINSIKQTGVVKLRESSSLTILFTDGSKWRKSEIDTISKGLYSLLYNYRLARGNTQIPEGVSFLNQDEIPVSISPATPPPEPTDQRKVA